MIIEEPVPKYYTSVSPLAFLEIETLKEYITIDSTRRHVRIGRKQADGAWKFEEYFNADEQLWISPIGLPLSIDDIYAGVTIN